MSSNLPLEQPETIQHENATYKSKYICPICKSKEVNVVVCNVGPGPLVPYNVCVKCHHRFKTNVT
jgi:transcription elongation factor Elf1